MKPTRKQSLGVYYSPTVKTFHIVARLKDVPGALSSVLELLRDHVNLVNSISYSMEDDGAIWSGFGKSLSKAETEGKLEKLVKRSPMVLECEVKGSDQGLLIDSFHSGIEVAPDRPAVVFPLVGVSRIYDHLARILGSGGETILLEEGSALGKSSGQYLNTMLGHGRLDWKVKALLATYSVIGWGSASLEVEKPGARFRVRIRDCMECAGMGKDRKGCNLVRGCLTSAVSTLSGNEFKSEETKCRFRGDPFCEFLLSGQEA
ncbi:MAG: V4R domain-containing protein [Nitrososphaerales archaeon]|jgi:predicted hydrocarbon binding protein